MSGSKPTVAQKLWQQGAFLPGIRARMMAVVLLAMLPALLLMIITTIDERENAVATTLESAQATIRLVVAQQSTLINTSEQVLRLAASLPEVRSLNPTLCEERLQSVVNSVEGYLRMSVAAPNGDIVCRTPPDSTGSAFNNADRAYFQLAMQTREFVIGGYRLSTITQQPLLTFGYPILDEHGEVRAVLGAGLDIRVISDTMATLAMPDNSVLQILDSSGTVVAYHPEAERWVGQNVASAALFQHVSQTLARQYQEAQQQEPAYPGFFGGRQNPLEGTARLEGFDGITRWYAFTAIGPTSYRAPDSVLYVIAGYNESVLLAQANRTLARNLVGFGIIGVLALVVAWASAEWLVVARARQMIAAAARLQQGDWSTRTGFATDRSEMGQLASAFDAMAATLQQRDFDLHTLNSQLEERIAQRTEQLQTSNAQLLESQAELRRLSQELFDVVERERTRVSREVHDQLGQVLTGIKIDLASAQRRLAAGQVELAKEKVEAALGLVDETIQLARRIARELRPSLLDDFGLEAAIQWQLEELQQQNNLDCDFVMEGVDESVSPAQATVVFRVLQEALTNIVRHAQASHVHVVLTVGEENLRLVIQDNGRGIRPDEVRKSRSLGLLGMRERALLMGGQVEISGVEGKGTTVTLTLPLQPPLSQNGETAYLSDGASTNQETEKRNEGNTKEQRS